MQVFFDYHPVCYNVRMTYREEVMSTLESGVANDYIDRSFTLTFNLTGLIGGRDAAVASAGDTGEWSGRHVSATAAPAHCRI
jgi:hypothetical protein